MSKATSLIKELKHIAGSKMHGYKRLGTGLGALGGSGLGGTYALADTMKQDHEGKLEEGHKLKAYLKNSLKGGAIGAAAGAGLGFAGGALVKHRKLDAFGKQQMARIQSVQGKLPGISEDEVAGIYGPIMRDDTNAMKPSYAHKDFLKKLLKKESMYKSADSVEALSKIPMSRIHGLKRMGGVAGGVLGSAVGTGAGMVGGLAGAGIQDLRGKLTPEEKKHRLHAYIKRTLMGAGSAGVAGGLAGTGLGVGGAMLFKSMARKNAVLPNLREGFAEYVASGLPPEEALRRLRGRANSFPHINTLDPAQLSKMMEGMSNR